MFEKKRTVAVFDFDGTLTTKDSLLEFIKFSCGPKRLIVGLLIHLPLIVLMKINLLPNWKVKQNIFSWFFKGLAYEKFVQLGCDFADIIAKYSNHKTTNILQKHIQKGDDIYVVTASVEEWVRPYCERINVKTILGTKVEIVNGRLTGRFSTPNCYGQEKVSRLLEIEPARGNYYLFAYGDSRGDKELITYADQGIWVNNHGEICM